MITDEPHIIVNAKLKRTTNGAFLLARVSDGEEFWVPKSQCEWQRHDTWAIAKWFANKEGIE